LRAAAERGDVPVRGEIGFLHRVLGFGVVPEDRARQPIEQPVVPAHQRLERALVALDDPARERAVVLALRRLDRLDCATWLHSRPSYPWPLQHWMKRPLPAFPIERWRLGQPRDAAAATYRWL